MEGPCFKGLGYMPGPLCRNGLIPASTALSADGGCRLFALVHPSRVPVASLTYCLSSLGVGHLPTCLSPNQEAGGKPCEHTMLSLQPHFFTGSAVLGEGLFIR